jgi:hypothetical protein
MSWVCPDTGDTVSHRRAVGGKGPQPYHVGVYQATRPQHVHPQAQKRHQLLPRLVGVALALEHALEGVELGEHGKEQGVEVTGDIAAILGADHLDVGVVREDLAGRRPLLQLDEVNGLFDVAGCKFGGERVADVVGCHVDDVLLDEPARDILDLYFT